MKPLINKPMGGLYPPGSTIKPIVALSALENDVISPKFTVECKGSIDFYGRVYHCWKEKGHGFMRMREALKQSCDVYFYEIARRLGVDRLSVTAKKFGLGKKVFNAFGEEKAGVVPNTKWKKKYIGESWFLGETLITGIGQGYFQSTPLQLCLMMAQLANGGYEIKPRIIDDKYALPPIIDAWRERFSLNDSELNFNNLKLKKLYRNHENIKFILDALYGATNEPYGTSYRSRLTKPGYIYAGKTGTSQVRNITLEERELKLKNKDLPYAKRDHALFIGFAPYKNPRYAISVVVEHGGSGSSGAAPIAKQVIKKVLERHKLRDKYQLDLFRKI
jgi:penicillin-binding protein 2